MAYDTKNRRTLLFGGQMNQAGANSNELWAFDGVAWSLVDAGVRPAVRQAALAAYDPDLDRFVIFGGYAAAYLGDTWSFQDGGWLLLDGGLPPSRGFGGFAYDSARRVLVLYGGYNAATIFRDVWERGVTGGWVNRTPTVAPPAAESVQMSYDPRRGLAVALTATPSAVLWDGGAYRVVALDAGLPKWSAAQAYDESTGLVVATTGTDFFLDTPPSSCNWDGESCRPTTDEPTPRYFAAMVYDSAAERLFLYGGWGGDGGCNAETWIR